MPRSTHQEVEVVPPTTLDDEHVRRWVGWLEASDVRRTPFLYPQVAMAAAAEFPETRVAIIRQRGEPVAYLPFERHGRDARPALSAISDGDGIVVDPASHVDVATALRQADLRVLWYQHRDMVRSPLEPFDRRVQPAARVQIAGGFDEWAAARSSLVKQADRKRRKLEREVGTVSLDVRASEDMLPALVAMKSRQLGEPWSPDGRAAAALRSMAALADASPVTSVLSVLRAGDRVVAMSWGLVANGLLIISIPTYDVDLPRHSPGVVLHVELLRAMDQLGADEADLGLGINQTKARLMTHTVDLASGHVYASVLERAYRRARAALRRQVRGR